MKQLYTLLFTFLLFSFSTSVLAQTQVSIAEARATNPDGSAALDGEIVEVTGIVIGPNFRPAGLTFVLYSTEDNIGITIFALDDNMGYTVTDGDSLTVVGEVSPFNGLNEIIPSLITVDSQGNAIPDPIVVTELNESTESNLVRIEDVSLVDESQWQTGGSFNVDVSDGTNMYQVRIDSDTDISGMEAPQGVFDITGIGGQFDNEAPFDSGYQLFPRNAMDIDPYNITAIEYPAISIAQARQIDSEGVLTRDGERAELNGVVHGINLRSTGLQFFIIDATNTGIAVFAGSENFGYLVSQGDDITIKGELSQFNGLAQIFPDEITLNSMDNDLVDPLMVSTLGEFTEGSLVTINAINLADEMDWMDDGSSFNIGVVTPDEDTLTVRIDDLTDLAGMPLSMISFPAFITGIGSQFDTSEPYDSGYQVLPRNILDIVTYLSVENIYEGEIKIYPNPAIDVLTIDTQDRIESIQVFDLTGKEVIRSGATSRLDISNLNTGMYTMMIQIEDKIHIEKIHVAQ